ncbi:MAG: Chromosomal replication initiator protein DnaA [Phycisphaerae bacterium]|nr:Chromosomal replication initiator protein DnaA [Phycisphaerae bacterium]
MDYTATETVCALREGIAERIGVQRFKTWFGESTRFVLSDESLHVLVGNEFVGDWISSNYRGAIEDATRNICGRELKVEIAVGGENGGVSVPAGVARRAARQEAAAAAMLPRGDLESFVVGPTNALAHAAALTVARALANTFRPLVLHGGCGLGKTHLLQGLYNAARRLHPTAACRYTSGEEFTNEFVSAVKFGRLDAFRARLRTLDLLLIDDIHFLANKRATQEEFLHTFNAIDSYGKQIVMTCDTHPRGMSLSDALVSRLVAGMVVKIDPPDFATRREILVRRAAGMGRTAPNDVLEFIARHVTSNVRELEGALFKLFAVASLNRTQPTVGLARAVLDEYLESVDSGPSRAVEIERIVAAYFGCTREMLHSEMRGRTITVARSIAMYLIRKHTQLSFPEIGRLMGNKNHSTVLMAARRVDNLLVANGSVTWLALGGKQEQAVCEVLCALEQRLGSARA